MDEFVQRCGGALVIFGWRGGIEIGESFVADTMEAVNPDNTLLVTQHIYGSLYRNSCLSHARWPPDFSDLAPGQAALVMVIIWRA